MLRASTISYRPAEAHRRGRCLLAAIEQFGRTQRVGIVATLKARCAGSDGKAAIEDRRQIAGAVRARLYKRLSSEGAAISRSRKLS